jgi:hypothetical protein
VSVFTNVTRPKRGTRTSVGVTPEAVMVTVPGSGGDGLDGVPLPQAATPSPTRIAPSPTPQAQ